MTRLLLASNPADGRDGLPPVPLPGDDGEHLVVHQAAGAIAGEAGLDIPADLDLIRARAFAHSQPAETIAAQVLSRDLHLAEPD